MRQHASLLAAPSTAAALRYGDRKAFELLRAHDELSRQAIEENNGRVVKYTGDGFMCAFSTVVDALNSAVQLYEIVWAPEQNQG